MSWMASQISSVSIVCSTVCSGADQRKHQSSASLVFVKVIHWWPVDSLHKRPVTRKMLPFDDVIMFSSENVDTEWPFPAEEFGYMISFVTNYSFRCEIVFGAVITASPLTKYRIKYDLSWRTILVLKGWLANDFHEWRSYDWKSLKNQLTRDQNVIHGEP